MKSLDAKQFLLFIPQNKIKDRIYSTLKFRNENWRKYIDSIGSLDKTVEIFTKQQDNMLVGFDVLKSYINVELINIDDVDNELYKKVVLI